MFWVNWFIAALEAEYSLPILEGGLDDALNRSGTNVVHQDIHAAEAVDAGVHCSGSTLGCGGISNERFVLAALLAHPVTCRCRRVGVDIDTQDSCAQPRKVDRCCLARSPAGTR